MKKPKNQVLPEKQLLKKHVAAIHINARLSLLQRKLVNALLYNAYEGLLTEKEHSINAKILCDMIGFDSKNTSYLKGALKGLMETVIEFDVLDNDGGTTWEAMVLLPYARIKDGVCTYKYESSLAEKLYHPDIYSQINLSILREMKSSHALALYESCYRFVGVNKTSWWDVDIFRKLMGVDQMPSYKPFKALNRNVIQPAIKEVNKLSNIHIEMETSMKGRTVTGLRFHMKPNSQLSLVELETEDEIAVSKAYKALLEVGISKTLARSWVIDFGEEYVFDKLDLTFDRASSGKIKSSKAGFLKSAIEQDYKNENKEKKDAENKHVALREQRFADERELLRSKEELRELEDAFRRECSQRMTKAALGLSDGDRAALEDEFSKVLSSKVLQDRFKQDLWASKIVSSQAQKFWISKGLDLPTLTEFAAKNSKPNPEIRKVRIAELEKSLA